MSPLYFEDLPTGDIHIPATYELSEDEIIAFAQRWDPQPFHVDPLYAAQSPMKGLFASSAHTYSIAALLFNQMEPAVAGIGSLKQEMELPNPARPGDILSLQDCCVDKRPSTSKPDRALVTLESTLVNQHGIVILRLRSLMMIKRRPN